MPAGRARGQSSFALLGAFPSVWSLKVSTIAGSSAATKTEQNHRPGGRNRSGFVLDGMTLSHWQGRSSMAHAA